MKTMMEKTLNLALLLGTAMVAPAQAANGLGVEATEAAVSGGTAGAIGFTISNDGTQVVTGVRWYPVSGYSVQCAVQTAGGRGFGLDGVLQAGDRANCTMVPTAFAAARARGAAVLVSGRAADGTVSVRHAGMSVLGALTPAQGIVVVAGGAVHADADLDGQLDAGETIAYDITLVNAGTEALSSLAVSDLAGAVACPATTLAVDASMVCTSSYAVSASDATAGFVLNEIDVTGTAANSDAVQAADVILTLNLAGTAGIRVFKSPLLFDDVDASGYASAGDVLGYTFLIKNSNAQALATVNLLEPDPSLIDGPIVCEATTLVAGQPFALGSGTLASQDVARCAAAHTITAAEAQAGEALNLAEASGVPAIGPPVQGTGASAVGIPAAGQLVVTKTVNTPTTTVGDTVTYTVTVRNAGSTAIANVTISDPVPTGITTFAWACTGTGVACPAATGTGAITAAVPVFPAGAQLVYTVTALVAFGAPPTILNVVTVTPQTNVVCAPAATPPPCSATVPLGTGQVVEVPLGNPAILLTMAALLGFAAASRLRRRVR
jgi:uncharacterized repeat protein (TIGR01451 family)